MVEAVGLLVVTANLAGMINRGMWFFDEDPNICCSLNSF